MSTEYTPVRVPMTVEASEETVPMTAEEDSESVSMTLGTSINPTVLDMDYANASNKPSINGHELAAGANSLGDIGVYSADEVDDLLDDKADVTDLSAHEADTTAHVTAAEKAAWSGKADPADIPTKTSELTNDSGFVTDNDVPGKLSDLTDDLGIGTHIADTTKHITAAERQSWNGKQDAISDLATIRSGAALGATAVQTETDPTVPSWAKAASKPTYTASEIGLGNVDNTADADKPVSTATQAAIQNVIPYIIGTQTAATNAWTGTAPFAALQTGQAIIYHLPFAGTSTAATLELTLSDGSTTTGAIDVLRLASSTVTTTFAAGCDIFMVFDGTDWKVSAYVDSNTNTIGYQLRTNSTSLPMSSAVYRYRLLFTSADGTKFVPANSSTSTNATASRAVCQDKIDPWGRIVYYGYTTAISAGSRPGAAYLWDQYVVTLGYSFNRTGAALALTSWKPVYVKATPQTDGSAIIDATTPYVQALPTTEDGSIYIFLGIAVSATTIELVQCHPVYIFRNGKIQIFTGMEAEIDDIKSRLAALEGAT